MEGEQDVSVSVQFGPWVGWYLPGFSPVKILLFPFVIKTYLIRRYLGLFLKILNTCFIRILDLFLIITLPADFRIHQSSLLATIVIVMFACQRFSVVLSFLHVLVGLLL